MIYQSKYCSWRRSLLHPEPKAHLRCVAHAVRRTSSNRCSCTNDLSEHRSRDSSVPLLSSAGALVIPVSHPSLGPFANPGRSSPSVEELSAPAGETRRWTRTFSCHFQVQTSPLSCCGSSTGEELCKVQQSVPFKRVLQRTDVTCWFGLDEAMRLFMETDLWRSPERKLRKCFFFGLSQICARKHNQFQRDEMYFYCRTCAAMLFKRIPGVTHQRVFVLVF